jgi:hypothetical protein
MTALKKSPINSLLPFTVERDPGKSGAPAIAAIQRRRS